MFGGGLGGRGEDPWFINKLIPTYELPLPVRSFERGDFYAVTRTHDVYTLVYMLYK